MTDRIPTKPGRILIEPENGAAPFYAVVSMADAPTEDGTQWSKANVLTDATATLIADATHETLPANPTVNDVLAALGGAVVDIVTGSYAGTGTYGGSNPNILTFNFSPKMVFVFSTQPSVNQLWGILVNATTDLAVGVGFMFQDCSVVFDGLSLYWYSNDSAVDQGNSNGITYYYVAIG